MYSAKGFEEATLVPFDLRNPGLQESIVVFCNRTVEIEGCLERGRALMPMQLQSHHGARGGAHAAADAFLWIHDGSPCILIQ